MTRDEWRAVNTRADLEKQIEEIVFEVEGGQLYPWTATRRLVKLFRVHLNNGLPKRED